MNNICVTYSRTKFCAKLKKNNSPQPIPSADVDPRKTSRNNSQPSNNVKRYAKSRTTSVLREMYKV